jgi:hypothetical protein
MCFSVCWPWQGGMDNEFTVSLAGDALHRVEAVYLGPGLSGVARQRKCKLGRIDISIQWIPSGSQ